MASLDFKLELDMSDLDAALEKAERLKMLLNEIAGLSPAPLHIIASGPLSAEDVKRLRETFKNAHIGPHVRAQ